MDHSTFIWTKEASKIQRKCFPPFTLSWKTTSLMQCTRQIWLTSFALKPSCQLLEWYERMMVSYIQTADRWELGASIPYNIIRTGRSIWSWTSFCWHQIENSATVLSPHTRAQLFTHCQQNVCNAQVDHLVHKQAPITRFEAFQTICWVFPEGGKRSENRMMVSYI